MPRYKIVFCSSSELARAKKCSFKGSWIRSPKEKEGALVRYKYKIGDLLLVNQFVISTPVWLTKGFGRETGEKRYYGEAIYRDAFSDVNWIQNQVSLGHGKT